MRKILKFFALTAILCCVSMTVHAADSFTYRKVGKCEIIICHHSHWLSGTYTTYGLAKNGAEILPPECEFVSYNEELHILVFRKKLVYYRQYEIILFCADNGKKIHSDSYYEYDKPPYITFDAMGMYTQAVVHCYDPRYGDRTGRAQIPVGKFIIRNGRLHMIQQRPEDYEAPI